MNQVTIVCGKQRRRFGSFRDAMQALRAWVLLDEVERDLLTIIGLY